MRLGYTDMEVFKHDVGAYPRDAYEILEFFYMIPDISNTQRLRIANLRNMLNDLDRLRPGLLVPPYLDDRKRSDYLGLSSPNLLDDKYVETLSTIALTMRGKIVGLKDVAKTLRDDGRINDAFLSRVLSWTVYVEFTRIYDPMLKAEIDPFEALQRMLANKDIEFLSHRAAQNIETDESISIFDTCRRIMDVVEMVSNLNRPLSNRELALKNDALNLLTRIIVPISARIHDQIFDEHDFNGLGESTRQKMIFGLELSCALDLLKYYSPKSLKDTQKYFKHDEHIAPLLYSSEFKKAATSFRSIYMHMVNADSANGIKPGRKESRINLANILDAIVLRRRALKQNSFSTSSYERAEHLLYEITARAPSGNMIHCSGAAVLHSLLKKQLIGTGKEKKHLAKLDEIRSRIASIFKNKMSGIYTGSLFAESIDNDWLSKIEFFANELQVLSSTFQQHAVDEAFEKWNDAEYIKGPGIIFALYDDEILQEIFEPEFLDYLFSCHLQITIETNLIGNIIAEEDEGAITKAFAYAHDFIEKFPENSENVQKIVDLSAQILKLDIYLSQINLLESNQWDDLGL